MSRPLSVDLVVATVDRAGELDRLLASVEEQGDVAVRVLVVDQNGDDRLGPVLAGHATVDVTRLQSPARGLSRARNRALPHLEGDVVAFPDDDCSYPPRLLAEVCERLGADPGLDGLLGRTADPEGRPATRRFATEGGRLDRATVWTRGNSASLFVRRSLVERVGGFDEGLGLGSGSGMQGEEVDWLIRALDLGAALEYDPGLVVLHPSPERTPDEARAAALRAGVTVGHLLRRHRYGLRTLTRMLVRPVGGAAASLVRGDVGGARAHLTTLRGRVRGYRTPRAAS